MDNTLAIKEVGGLSLLGMEDGMGVNVAMNRAYPTRYPVNVPGKSLRSGLGNDLDHAPDAEGGWDDDYKPLGCWYMVEIIPVVTDGYTVYSAVERETTIGMGVPKILPCTRVAPE